MNLSIPGGDLDLLVIGETLIDFISVEETESLLEATTFQRFAGGSPANIAANVANWADRRRSSPRQALTPLGNSSRRS